MWFSKCGASSVCSDIANISKLSTVNVYFLKTFLLVPYIIIKALMWDCREGTNKGSKQESDACNKGGLTMQQPGKNMLIAADAVSA